MWQGTKRTGKAVNLKITAVINPAMLNWKELERTLRSAPTGLSLLFTAKTWKQRQPNSGAHPRPVFLNSTLYHKPRGLPKEGLAARRGRERHGLLDRRHQRPTRAVGRTGSQWEGLHWPRRDDLNTKTVKRHNRHRSPQRS